MAKRSDLAIVVKLEQELKEELKLLRGYAVRVCKVWVIVYCVNMWNKLNKCNKKEN